MGRMSVIGGFEELVLMAIINIGEGAYGVPIRKRVEQVTGRSVSVGSLYTTLERLQEKGFVSSYQGEPTPERGGRAKRYFKVEGAGQLALDKARRAREAMDGIRSGSLNPLGGLA